jgi:hypothetical protein
LQPNLTFDASVVLDVPNHPDRPTSTDPTAMAEFNTFISGTNNTEGGGVFQGNHITVNDGSFAVYFGIDRKILSYAREPD